MTYDLVVLGSGPGGYVAAIRAAQLGFKTAIIEKDGLGGICLNWGCIPAKALLKSAQVYEDIKRAKEYGIDATATPDFSALIKRSRSIADKMSRGVEYLMRKNKIDVFRGFGKLVSPNKLEVALADDKTQLVEGRHIVIATGARSRELPNMKLDGKKIFGYREALNLSGKPESIIIVGSGAIGVEFAYFFNCFGTKVTIIEFQPHLIPTEDEDISKELEMSFRKAGINILFESNVTKIDASGTGVKVFVSSPSGEQIFDAELVLSAVGITSNIEGIGLETLGVKMESGKIAVDKYYKTNIAGIYSIGDCIPGPALAHVASKEGIICIESIAFRENKIDHEPEPLDYNNIPGCTYCSPEIASVGFTEKKARELGYEIKVGKFPLFASGKASGVGHTEGFIKVIYEAKTAEWLGAHMIGYNVTESIIEAVVGRKLETTSTEVLDSLHPHPTISESIKDATEVAFGEAIHL